MAATKTKPRGGRRRSVVRRQAPAAATVAPTVDPDGYISVEKFAAYFDISTMSVYRMIKRRELAFIRVGRVIRLPANSIQEFQRNNRVGVKALCRK